MLMNDLLRETYLAMGIDLYCAFGPAFVYEQP